MILDFIETDEQWHNGIALEEYNGKYPIVRAYRANDENVYVKWGYPQKNKEPIDKAIPWKVELGNTEQAISVLQSFILQLGGNTMNQPDDEDIPF